MKRLPKLAFVLFAGAACGVQGCGKKASKGTPANLALVTPPVQAATPKGLLSSASSLRLNGLSSADFKSRFFEGGPTDIMTILASIDTRISDINMQTKNTTMDCVKQDPVAYDITVAGQSVPMYAQCSQTLSEPSASANDPHFLQWGVKDGVTYIFTAIGAGRSAAIVTPISGAPGKYTVQAWLSVGVTNAPSWSSGSYAVIELQADSSNDTLEMAVAGIGIGYCGAQLKSDGTNIYAKGSADGPGCAAVADLCVLASDATSAGTCGTGVETFELTPIGRTQTTLADGTTEAASTYPAAPNITLNGTTSDPIFFGPSAPTPGVGAMK